MKIQDTAKPITRCKTCSGTGYNPFPPNLCIDCNGQGEWAIETASQVSPLNLSHPAWRADDDEPPAML